MRILIILLILLSCYPKDTTTENIQISIESLKESDKPYPIIILTNKKNERNIFPKQYYQISKENLKDIKKLCSSENKKPDHSRTLLLITVNQTKYFFDDKKGHAVLEEIQDITSHYNNKDLNGTLLFLQKISKR